MRLELANGKLDRVHVSARMARRMGGRRVTQRITFPNRAAARGVLTLKQNFTNAEV